MKPGNEMYVHHLLMYACKISEEQEDMFAMWAEQDGVLCYGVDHPLEWRQQCRSVLIAWAVGGEVRGSRLSGSLSTNSLRMFVICEQIDSPVQL